MSNIQITLPDGSQQSVEAGSRPIDIAAPSSIIIAFTVIFIFYVCLFFLNSGWRRQPKTSPPHPNVAATQNRHVIVHRKTCRLGFSSPSTSAGNKRPAAAPDEKKTIDRGVTKTGTSGVVGIPGIRADKSTR